MVTETGKIFILEKAITDNNLKLDLNVKFNINGVQQTDKSLTCSYGTPSAIGGGTVTVDIASSKEYTFADTSTLTTFITSAYLVYDEAGDNITIATETLTGQSLLYGGTLTYTAFAIGLT